MKSESRKAVRESLALQRAQLHFTTRPLAGGLPQATLRNTAGLARTRRDIVRAGLLGFVPRMNN